MKILITGASGFVGKNILEEINSRENKLIATAPDRKILEAFIEQNNLKNIAIEELDITKPKECDSIIKNVDIVIHLAALINIGISLDDPRKTSKINYNGTLNILEAMRRNNIKKIIFSSTQDIYGNNINGKEDEVEKIDPMNMYSLSKLF